MPRLWITRALLCLIISGCAHRSTRQDPIDGDEVINAIAARYWRIVLKASPTWASYLGHRDHDGYLPDISAKGRQTHTSALRTLQRSLNKMNSEHLSPRSQIIAGVLRTKLEQHFSNQVCREWTWVVDQLNGPQVWLAEIPNYHLVDDAKRAASLLERYAAIRRLFRDHITNLRQGLATGWTASRINVARVLEQLDTLLATPVKASPFVKPVLARLDAKIPSKFTVDLNAVVKDQVYPALREYQIFLRDELNLKSRIDVGVSRLPDGPTCYAARIKTHTGLNLTAAQIHRVGLTEVARIQQEMQVLVNEMGGGDVETFLADLADRPDQHLESRDALLEYNRRLVERAQRVMPKLVGRQPRAPIIVKPIESFRERDAPAAYYYSAPPDGSRPAAYYLNTYAPKTRLLYKMAALAFHEALPGHHVQLAIAGENQALPALMRHGGQTAFIEGWALYSERLAAEFGLYETAEERLGALTYEIWRAARLVVDTGLHAKGWSRERAIDYLALHTGHDPGEVINEVDRYIIWPGQALAYKMGQLEISRLRTEVEDTLGDGFDLRAFHDQVLNNGALPMEVLRQVIARWLGHHRD
jgi:uncharacterized protein (DUF885 family)